MARTRNDRGASVTKFCLAMEDHRRTDAGRVRLMLTESITNNILVMGPIGFGIIVALVFCWRVTLVILACIPLVFMGMVIQRKIVFEIAAQMRGNLKSA